MSALPALAPHSPGSRNVSVRILLELLRVGLRFGLGAFDHVSLEHGAPNAWATYHASGALVAGAIRYSLEALRSRVRLDHPSAEMAAHVPAISKQLHSLWPSTEEGLQRELWLTQDLENHAHQQFLSELPTGRTTYLVLNARLPCPRAC